MLSQVTLFVDCTGFFYASITLYLPYTSTAKAAAIFSFEFLCQTGLHGDIVTQVTSFKHMFARLLCSHKCVFAGKEGSARFYTAILLSTVKLLQLGTPLALISSEYVTDSAMVQ